jgi:hypothetical protein
MSVISLVIAPALKSWQYSATEGTISWEPRSVGLGAGLLIVLFMVLYQIQKMIDAGYAIKQKEVADDQAAADKEERAAAKVKADYAAANPIASIYNQVRALLMTTDATKGHYEAVTAENPDAEAMAAFMAQLNGTAPAEVAPVAEVAEVADATAVVATMEIEKPAETKAE